MARKVLIVDDEAHIRMLLGQILEELSDEYAVEILMAKDGEEGWRAIQEHRPEVVLLDIMMPRMNGYELCRLLHGDPSVLEATQIVLLTAKGQESDKRQGLETGAVAYMTKPFDPDELLLLTKSLMGLNGE
ncbi:MAG: two-component system, OmpR family, alkaline phosphatase synthesis response regulator PhoP [Desulfovibrionales bacterium]|jgi:CheY-like chemotaxis protein|nr:two-component system, OmpR family, alkaline phosphatase synthesis response regulator PhoP [Desulfovibrionales bacterium]